ncbi:alpha/beta-Hydrolases superfamily protein [Trifolium repens]|nr:alpha/beta-Hydrolases superfamily protein [Trifolium repens]
MAIVGHSKGANVVLLYASKYHDIKTVANLSGRYDLKAGLEDRLGKDFIERIRKEGFIELKTKSGSVDYRITEESLKDRLSINMHEACQQIDKECRFLTVHGDADTIIPVGDALEFFEGNFCKGTSLMLVRSLMNLSMHYAILHITWWYISEHC